MLNHQPVLCQTAIDYFAPRITAHTWFIDATFGAGGHARLLLEKGARVIGLDYDPVAITAGKQLFKNEIEVSQNLILMETNFDQIDQVVVKLRQQGKLTADDQILGALFDLGTNSDQLTSSDRGLSFSGDGPLDMRLSSGLNVTARDLLLALPEKQLADMFAEIGGEEQAKGIARAVVRYRQQIGSQQAFQSTSELVEIIEKVKGRHHHSHLHPATKTFQALRIIVNDELGNLERALPLAWSVLAPTGRLVTIAFHEGEDRLAKHFFKKMAEANQAELLTKHPVVPDIQELKINPRARSAKLRAGEKIK